MMSAIIAGLKFLGDKLTSLVPAFLGMKRANRDRIATYCDNVAACLTDAFRDLERGVIPHGRCQEMERYMLQLRDVLEESLPPQEFDDLHGALRVAYDVENLDRELLPTRRPGSKYAELDMAAGRFRSVAAKLRAT
jgi:hypothetical protein